MQARTRLIYHVNQAANTGMSHDVFTPGVARRDDCTDLPRTLDEKITSLLYEEREKYISITRDSMAIDRSFFTTERMIREYASNAYHLELLMHESVEQN